MTSYNQILFFALSLVLVACGPNVNLAPPAANSAAAIDLAETMSVKITGYTPQAGQSFKNIFVSNFSIKAANGQLNWSTARDSMPDTLKQALMPTYGFSSTSPESVVAGFADLLLYQAGITLEQQALLVCAQSDMGNSSGDAFVYNDSRYTGNPQTFLGLRDCDKTYMGLNPQTFDFNSNGIPDYLEFRCGMNPLNPNEAFLSTAGDGVENIVKCQNNIPIDENANTPANQLFAYQYVTQQNSDGTKDFTINNISILNGNSGNFLAFFIVESNSSTGIEALYTAYAIVTAQNSNKTLQFSYWAKTPSQFTNQEIVAQ